MRIFNRLNTFAVAVALGLAFALPAGATSASSESAAGQPAPSEPSAAAGTSGGTADTAISGTAGSGGQGAGADMPSAAAGASAPAGFGASAGLDSPVRAERSGANHRASYGGWLAALVLLLLVIGAALRARRELRRDIDGRST